MPSAWIAGSMADQQEGRNAPEGSICMSNFRLIPCRCKIYTLSQLVSLPSKSEVQMALILFVAQSQQLADHRASGELSEL